MVQVYHQQGGRFKEKRVCTMSTRGDGEGQKSFGLKSAVEAEEKPNVSTRKPYFKKTDNLTFSKLKTLLEARERLKGLLSGGSRGNSVETETEYVDDTRNINVTLGKQDIKADISAAQEVLLPPPVSKETKLLISEAKASLSRGKPEQAYKVLRKVPRSCQKSKYSHSVQLLRGRAQLQLWRPERALMETEKTPENSETLGLKGDALYMLGRLEEALVYYHRALRGASQSERRGEVRDGVRRCEDAVLSTLARMRWPVRGIHRML